jgi:hypothetical protein
MTANGGMRGLRRFVTVADIVLVFKQQLVMGVAVVSWA